MVTEWLFWLTGLLVWLSCASGVVWVAIDKKRRKIALLLYKVACTTAKQQTQKDERINQKVVADLMKQVEEEAQAAQKILQMQPPPKIQKKSD